MKSLGSVISDIKPSYFLDPTSAVMVEMNRETVELAVAQDITPVQWDVMGGAETRYRVLAVMVPMVKSDAAPAEWDRPHFGYLMATQYRVKGKHIFRSVSGTSRPEVLGKWEMCLSLPRQNSEHFLTG